MPNISIQLFEHQELPYSQVEALSHASARKERILEAFEQINRACGRTVLHLGRKSLRASAHVGVIHAGGLTVEILPKIDFDHHRQDGDVRERLHQPASAVHNLLAMLAAAYRLPILTLPPAGLLESPGAWVEFLTRLFAAELRSQAAAGLSHQHINQEASLPALRGRWNVQRQVMRGSTRADFEVTYEALTVNTPLNQVFRLAVRLMTGLCQDSQTRLLLSDLEPWFEQVALPTTPVSGLFEQVQFNRLNEHFRPAYHLARMFLDGNVTHPSGGPAVSPSFLFDMNALFEQYLSELFLQYQREIFCTSGQTVLVSAQGKGGPLYLAKSEGREAVRLRPDLTFRGGTERTPFLIADTKYKALARGAGYNGNPAPEDTYQALAYAVSTGCRRVLLLYPQSGDPVRKQLLVEKAGCVISICTVNLHVPLAPPNAILEELKQIVQYART